MKAYCYYQLGNMEYQQKQYEKTKKMQNKGKSLPGIENYLKYFFKYKINKINNR